MGECIIAHRSVVKNEYQKLADITVSSATTNVDITGLNIGKDEEIVLVCDINSVNSDHEMYLTVNGNNTITNYWHQRMYGAGATVGGARANTPLFIGLLNGKKGFVNSKIKLTNNGYFVFQSSTIRDYTTIEPFIQEYYGTSTFTMTSITSLRIASSGANGLGTGSRFQLYRVAK